MHLSNIDSSDKYHYVATSRADHNGDERASHTRNCDVWKQPECATPTITDDIRWDSPQRVHIGSGRYGTVYRSAPGG